MKEFYEDLRAAGIEHEDKGNGRVDFHCFRVTFTTLLGRTDASDIERTKLTGHNDPRVAANSYTDRRLLRLAEAVDQIEVPKVVEAEGAAEGRSGEDASAQRNAPTAVGASVSVSCPVPSNERGGSGQSPVNTGSETLSVVAGHAESIMGETVGPHPVGIRGRPLLPMPVFPSAPADRGSILKEWKSFSPGLLGTSYPGSSARQAPNSERVVSIPKKPLVVFDFVALQERAQRLLCERERV